MNKIFYVFFIVIFSWSATQAQHLITDANVALKPGIYRNFSEFKHNKPSINLPENHKISRSGPKSVSSKAVFRRRPLEKTEIYGFCDGKNIYVYPRLADVSKKPATFNKITYLGRYATYASKSKYEVPSASSASGTMPVTDKAEYALDMGMGQFIALTPEKVAKLIADDVELSAAFKKQSFKKKHLTDYIIRYAQKHPEIPTPQLNVKSPEIAPVRNAPIELE
ncbi:hypothetical protein I5M27_13280 [Adhaeribacter sp. BT258]|uniref:Uncharacterized protein n=1 Tax=Adhaeribacter terrigena TaxID=2793070 RepID=A0ABS1C3H0_9BACT|nr:hypothetical protein [Adhaeribacter terrigena]MBK0403961.1 hypothetical protein [Adhaeribacter terrigena]